MPARIRLMVKGSPTNRFYWIVAQSSKKRVQGFPIERLGYWIPDNKGVYENRSIVLNRPRLKYWLGVGAEPTEGIQRLLAKVDFLPKKPPPFGTATLYPRPEYIAPSPPPVLRDLGAANPFRAEVEAMEKANEERKKSYLDNAHKQFHVRDSQPLQEEMQEYVEKYNLYLQKMSDIIPNDEPNRLELFVKLLGLFNIKNDDEVTAETLVTELGLTKEKATSVLETYKSVQIRFDRADLDDFKYNLSIKCGRKLKAGDKFYVPPINPITPVPNFDDDIHQDLPQKLFDIKHPARPNKLYGITIEPNIEK